MSLARRLGLEPREAVVLALSAFSHISPEFALGLAAVLSATARRDATPAHAFPLATEAPDCCGGWRRPR